MSIRTRSVRLFHSVQWYDSGAGAKYCRNERRAKQAEYLATLGPDELAEHLRHTEDRRIQALERREWQLRKHPSILAWRVRIKTKYGEYISEPHQDQERCAQVADFARWHLQHAGFMNLSPAIRKVVGEEKHKGYKGKARACWNFPELLGTHDANAVAAEGTFWGFAYAHLQRFIERASVRYGLTEQLETQTEQPATSTKCFSAPSPVSLWGMAITQAIVRAKEARAKRKAEKNANSSLQSE